MNARPRADIAARPEAASVARELLRLDPQSGDWDIGWILLHGYFAPGATVGRWPATAAELAAMCRAEADGDHIRPGMSWLYAALSGTPGAWPAAVVGFATTVRRLYRLAVAYAAGGDMPPDLPSLDDLGACHRALLRLAAWSDRQQAGVGNRSEPAKPRVDAAELNGRVASAIDGWRKKHPTDDPRDLTVELVANLAGVPTLRSRIISTLAWKAFKAEREQTRTKGGRRPSQLHDDVPDTRANEPNDAAEFAFEQMLSRADRDAKKLLERFTDDERRRVEAAEPAQQEELVQAIISQYKEMKRDARAGRRKTASDTRS